MTSQPHRTFVPEVQSALTQYTVETFVHEWPLQATIMADAQNNGLPQISLQPDEGWMIYFLLKSIHAKTVVEIGTLAGYSASWIARALPDDGMLYTLEANAKHAEIAQTNFEALNLSHKIELIVGNAHQTLGLLHDQYDAVFIDADKESYLNYLDWSLQHVRSGGLIMAHNAFRGGDIYHNPDDVDAIHRPALIAMREFNQRVADNARLVSTILPAGDGLLVALVE